MLRTPKRAGLIAVLAIIPLALAACGGTGGSSNGSSDEGASGAKTLKLWHYEGADSAMGKAWDESIRVFEKEHKGVKVKFERKAFEQIQQTAGMVLSSDQGPDLLEYNKGNATAGLLSSQGLLTDLSKVAKDRGWDSKLAPSLQTTARYDKGVMGSGKWYGIPNYGEFVTVYYNKDMFKAAGLEVPTTLDDMTADMDKFVAKGVTPLAMSGAEYPAGQLYYELALSKADRGFVNNYQMYKGKVDFQADPLKYGADTFAQWVKAGYIAKDSASLKAEDAGVNFISGKSPMLVSGSWWYGRFVTDMAKTDWGIFNFPGNKLNAGSSGNLWVVPKNSKAKDLAYDFIDITMRPEIQAIIGNNGGLPVAANAKDITDPKSSELITQFNKLLDNDGLAFYPDWPVPGYYDVLVSGFQSLINSSTPPAKVLDTIGKAYDDGVANM
ncbi:ABC transporter substrate-binding protein [Pengzhenrongella sp.]|jgi:raffinose/stachyose/melibiose transport system substrate-binding protein|uniref:ABC transporter substrate-binding protein n=1 Tax=Pengzhenrongella sp. TaxID=2888820 RepID=UPI002F935CE5